jgi:hypothetical protein
MSVSIEIGDDVYSELSQMVGDDVRRATEQAIREWMDRRKAFANDPFYKLKPVALGAKDIASTIDPSLYGGDK